MGGMCLGCGGVGGMVQSLGRWCGVMSVLGG